ncbi:hypothetical protein [Pinibacter soli]|uniref:DUF4974 domain-containing protein n=1 Tax=Pinibacter soli TaxID=3044211 RepID=A0ABT6REH8_9BACT|nr:hypothetical protein [Pinibacter soli]MDI3320952.1 hypothetical protein [Pinibacter soli]
MTNELLKNYFERTCSEREAAIVEEWLMEPQNQQAFERFLESYWQEHLDEQSSIPTVTAPKEVRKGIVRRYLPRLAAAAVLGFIIAGSYYFISEKTEPQKNNPAIAKTIVKQEPIDEHVVSNTLHAYPQKINVHQSKTKQHDKKALSEPALVKDSVVTADTVSREPKPKSVKMTPMGKVMINEVALNKLDSSEQLKVLNQMALRVSINNASFNEIAAILQTKYGIVLELCETGKPDVAGKMYTAHFQQVSFPDLIDDMSKQMLFSYTITDKKTVKICFN